jgi:hypothetical protein
VRAAVLGGTLGAVGQVEPQDKALVRGSAFTLAVGTELVCECHRLPLIPREQAGLSAEPTPYPGSPQPPVPVAELDLAGCTLLEI